MELAFHGTALAQATISRLVTLGDEKHDLHGEMRLQNPYSAHFVDAYSGTVCSSPGALASVIKALFNHWHFISEVPFSLCLSKTRGLFSTSCSRPIKNTPSRWHLTSRRHVTKLSGVQRFQRSRNIVLFDQEPRWSKTVHCIVVQEACMPVQSDALRRGLGFALIGDHPALLGGFAVAHTGACDAHRAADSNNNATYGNEDGVVGQSSSFSGASTFALSASGGAYHLGQSVGAGCAATHWNRT
ncbi:hypothetical protein FA15DRAFT_657153 [Coprinopsis marcescibilis]|uniref:Uncharacterized protein n=1 Tax=Coprinopsis marcescibilis TaxID=230819 RepID=A0A5C3L3W0_COPMA|nr:hypothetical protein FA15DRAFT_657153 [Coprinopsis marcescibilis]